MDNRYHPFVAGMEKLARDMETTLQVYTWIAFALVVVILLIVIYLFICEVKEYKSAGKKRKRVRSYAPLFAADARSLTGDHQ